MPIVQQGHKKQTYLSEMLISRDNVKIKWVKKKLKLAPIGVESILLALNYVKSHTPARNKYAKRGKRKKSSFSK